MSALQGFNNQKKIGSSQYATIQPLGSDKFGLDVSNKLAFAINNGNPLSIVDAFRLETNPQILQLEITAHGARVGDVIRFEDTPNENIELSVLTIVDADNLQVAFTGGVSVPVATDEVLILRFITARADEAGSITLGPARFLYNGSSIQVEEDTVTPANNRPNPSKLFFQKNGVTVPVNKDTGTPANTSAIPVEIVAAAGTEINITAGDINVQTTDMGASFDSMRIGDGSGRYIEVNTDNEALTHDAKVEAAIIALDSSGLGLATEAKQNAMIVELQNILADTALIEDKDFATEATLAAQALNIASIAAEDFATETTLAALAAEDFATETTLAALAAEDFATEATLSAVNGKLPATLGQKAEAASLAVTLSTEDIAVLNSIATGGSKTGTITQAVITVGTTAVRATVSGAAPNAARKKLFIKPTIGNSGNIFLGSSAVTTANGLQIVGPDRLEFEVDASDYYLISDAAAQSVEIMEVV